jgi:hypothetical protein
VPLILEIINALSYNIKLVDSLKLRISKRPKVKVFRTFIKEEFKTKTSNVIFIDVAEGRCNYTNINLIKLKSCDLYIILIANILAKMLRIYITTTIRVLSGCIT